MSHIDDVGRPAGLDSQQSTPLTPTSFFGSDQGQLSDIGSCATSVPETVMAEQVANDVVKEAQSVGRPAPIDDTASTTNTSAASGEQPSGPATTDSKFSDAPSDPTNTTTTTDSASAADEKPSANGDAAAATVSAKDTSVRICTKHTRLRIMWSSQRRRARMPAIPCRTEILLRCLALNRQLSTAKQSAAQTQTSVAPAV